MVEGESELIRGVCFAADSDWVGTGLSVACGSPVSALILDTHTEALASLCLNGSSNPATRKRKRAWPLKQTINTSRAGKFKLFASVSAVCLSVSLGAGQCTAQCFIKV